MTIATTCRKVRRARKKGIIFEISVQVYEENDGNTPSTHHATSRRKLLSTEILQRYKHKETERTYGLSDIKATLSYGGNEELKDSRNERNACHETQDGRNKAMQAVDRILEHRERAMQKLHRCTPVKHQKYWLGTPASTCSTSCAVEHTWTPHPHTGSSVGTCEGLKYSPTSPAFSMSPY
jgi:hypothetical protein